MSNMHISKSENIRQFKAGNQYALVNVADFPEFSFDIFSPDYLKKHNLVTGTAAGRGTTWFFKHNGQEYVLRSYLRGGLVGKFLTNQFFHGSHLNSRSWQEFELLLKLQEWMLPAPRPVAAKVQRSGVIYRSYLISERISQAKDLHQILCEGPISASIWFNIGCVIAKFHAHGVYHHDLNIRNIMLDNQDHPWLIDFDKCEIRVDGKWKEDNLNRLKRSINKELSIERSLSLKSSDFDSLLEGYHSKT